MQFQGPHTALRNILAYFRPFVCARRNYNVNPRSTVGTYFRAVQFLINVFSSECHISREQFNFNNPDYYCQKCRGLGSVLVPSVIDSLDDSKSVSERAFRIWNVRDSELYNKLLFAYCERAGIPVDVPLGKMKPAHRDLLLNGVSGEKFKIAYRSAGVKRTKTTAFNGLLPFLNEQLQDDEVPSAYRNFYFPGKCPTCGGSRLSPDIAQYQVFGTSVKECLTMEFEDLQGFLRKRRSGMPSYVAGQFSQLLKFIESAIRMKLGYLDLSRAIPSLSGGELQRLSMAKAIVSQFNGFLYVFDEPTAALHPSEWQSVADAVCEVKKRGNTVLAIDHSTSLEDVADRVEYLGPGAGGKGGEFVKPYEDGYRNFAACVQPPFYASTRSVLVAKCKYNNIDLLNVKIPVGTLVGVCGVSGSGKTSFVQHVLPHYFPGLVYVNQEPIRGNSYSTVATSLDVQKGLVGFWAKTTGTQIANFDYIHAGRGQCAECSGTGRVIEKSAHCVTDVLCPECKGARYSKSTLRIKWQGMNLYEFLSKSIDEVLDVLPSKLDIARRLNLASQAGLGYLRLCQPIDTLSGGEAQRIKIVSKISHATRGRAFALDEPFRGVDAENAKKLLLLIMTQVEQGVSMFVVEHNPAILSCCSYIMEFGPASGSRGGRLVYNGDRRFIGMCKDSITARYLVPAQ